MPQRPRGKRRSTKRAPINDDNIWERTALRTTIHLIRHADASPDIGAPIDVWTTYDELGLSAKGVIQAAALARRIAAGRRRPAAVYTSSTRRARETAAALASALSLDANVDERLREMYLGDVSAGDVPVADRAAAIRARLDELAAIAQRDGSWGAVPQAEPAHSVRERMSAAIEAIVERHAGSHVALVSHAGTINAYLAGVIGATRDFFFLAGNTSLSSVTISAGAPMLIRLNDTAHLEDALARPNDYDVLTSTPS